MAHGLTYVFRHTCSDVQLSYEISDPALLVCKLILEGRIFGPRWKTMCSSIDVLTAVRLREGMSPVGSPGLSGIFAWSQKSTTPRTPSGPRLALQAAGPSTRPGEAEVTFPRRDTLPGSTDGRLFLLNINKVDNIPFAAAS